MTPFESAPHHDHLEIVYRWRVRQDAIDQFSARLFGIVETFVSAARDEDTVTARVSQPVLGPAADVWELRVEVPGLGQASRSLEQGGRGENELLWQLGAVGGPGDPDGSPVAEVLESSAPLLRTWVFPRRPEG